MDMTFDRHGDCGSNHFGVITSCVDRINDVPIYLARFGVIDLIPCRGDLLRLVSTWNRVAKTRSPICFMAGDNLVDGLDDDVAITDSVTSVGRSAVEDGILNH